MKLLIIFLLLIILIGLIIFIIGYLQPVKQESALMETLEIHPDKIWEDLTKLQNYKKWRRDLKEVIVDGPHHWTEIGLDNQRINYTGEFSEGRKMIMRIVSDNLKYGGRIEFVLLYHATGTRLMITEFGEIYDPFLRFFSRWTRHRSWTIEEFMDDVKRYNLPTSGKPD